MGLRFDNKAVRFSFQSFSGFQTWLFLSFQLEFALAKAKEGCFRCIFTRTTASTLFLFCGQALWLSLARVLFIRGTQRAFRITNEQYRKITECCSSKIRGNPKNDSRHWSLSPLPRDPKQPRNKYIQNSHFLCF